MKYEENKNFYLHSFKKPNYSEGLIYFETQTNKQKPLYVADNISVHVKMY
jgi:hypothetical protein